MITSRMQSLGQYPSRNLPPPWSHWIARHAFQALRLCFASKAVCHYKNQMAMALKISCEKLMRIFFSLLAAFVLCLPAGCKNQDETPTGVEPGEWIKDNPPASEATWANVSELLCKPSVLDICGPKECKPSEPKAFVVWKPSVNEYQRCDDSGCDTYAPRVAYSGSFTNIALPENGVLFKVSTDRNFVEIATMMDATFVYRGKCEPR